MKLKFLLKAETFTQNWLFCFYANYCVIKSNIKFCKSSRYLNPINITPNFPPLLTIYSSLFKNTPFLFGCLLAHLPPSSSLNIWAIDNFTGFTVHIHTQKFYIHTQADATAHWMCIEKRENCFIWKRQTSDDLFYK